MHDWGVGWGFPASCTARIGTGAECCLGVLLWPRGVPGWGPRLCQALLALLRVRGTFCLWKARGKAAHLLSASQNDYRIDPNQELLAMGKRPLGAGEQGVGIRPECPCVCYAASELPEIPVSAVRPLTEVLPFLSCMLPPPQAFLTTWQFPEKPEPSSHSWTGSDPAPGTSLGMEEVMTGTQTHLAAPGSASLGCCIPSPSPSPLQVLPTSWALSSHRIPSRAALAGG